MVRNHITQKRVGFVLLVIGAMFFRDVIITFIPPAEDVFGALLFGVILTIVGYNLMTKELNQIFSV